MSLESEIKSNTAAINRLADAVEKLLTLGHAPQSEKQQWLDSAPGTVAPESVKNSPKATAAELIKGYGGTPAQVADAGVLIPLTQAESEVKDMAAPLTLDDIKKALMATAAKFDAVTGTAKSKAILSRFGAQKLSQVPVESYVEFVALCETVAAGGEP